MPVRKFKPTSPGRRFMSISGFDEITASKPEKTLLESLPTHAGRNNQGRITTRHQGGGYRKLYRKIDFKRDKVGVPGKVATIEYDPNRSARIALVHYKDGEKRYILAPVGLKVGDPIESGPEAAVRIGNAMPRSEERRVGKECRSGWAPEHEKHKSLRDARADRHAGVDGARKCFFFSSRRRHTRWTGDWSSDVCSSDLRPQPQRAHRARPLQGRREAVHPGAGRPQGRRPDRVGPRGCGSHRQRDAEIGRASCRERV